MPSRDPLVPRHGRGSRGLERELTTASGARLSFAGGVVTKRHRAGTSLADVQHRLDAIVAAPFVQPLGPATTTDGWVVTRWPAVAPAEPDDPPWREAGALLAALHRVRVEPPPTLPAPTWPERVSRAAARTHDPTLAALGRRLADEAATHRGNRTTVIHGDWHLGQLGLTDAGWLLLDPDDVALGDPWWDLARPAGFWAAGLLPDDDWREFLDGYAPTEDPWPAVDLPARCAVLVAAVRARLHSEPTADSLLSACERMAQ